MAIVQFDPIGKFLYTKDDNGCYHSYDDKPAIEYLDETQLKIWYKNGLIHRDFNFELRNQKYAIIYKNIHKQDITKCYMNGKEY